MHRSDELVEPQSSILAKLCVYCIFSTLEYINSNPYRGNNRKRVRCDLDMDDLDALGMSNKLLRLNETGESVPMFGSQSPQAQSSNNGQKSMVVLKDPLMTALNNLFTIFGFLAGRDGEISQQTHFIFQFLQLTVQCGKDRTRIVLQGMPQTLVCYMIYLCIVAVIVYIFLVFNINNKFCKKQKVEKFFY